MLLSQPSLCAVEKPTPVKLRLLTEASSLAGFLSAVVARDLELSSAPESELSVQSPDHCLPYGKNNWNAPGNTSLSGRASNRQQWVALGVEMFFLFDLLN